MLLSVQYVNIVSSSIRM